MGFLLVRLSPDRGEGGLKRKGEVFLIHADYYGEYEVIIERAADSEVFSLYETFYIAPITTNKALIEKWLTQGD